MTARDLGEQFRAGLDGDCRTVVVVEGVSDLVAVEALARRAGHDLRREGVRVLPMGGITNLGHVLRVAGPGGLGLDVAGLYDVGDVGHVLRALPAAGIDCGSAVDLGAIGFFGCDADLEDELIRAVGEAGVEEVIARDGRLASFRVLQRQPAQRDRSITDQFRRFIGGRAGLKAHYARLLVDALDLNRAPAPLEFLLRRALDRSRLRRGPSRPPGTR